MMEARLSAALLVFLVGVCFTEAQVRELNISNSMSGWMLNCTQHPTFSHWFFDTEHVIDIMSVKLVDWYACNESSKLTDMSNGIQSYLWNKCDGKDVCFGRRDHYNGEYACEVRVAYRCVERGKNETTTSYATWPHEKTTDWTPSTDGDYTKTISSGKPWSTQTEELTCPVNNDYQYELEIVEVGYPHWNITPPCLSKTRSDQFKFLANRCNGKGICRWIADGAYGVGCYMTVGYNCHIKRTTPRMITDRTTTDRITADVVSYRFDEQIIGCDIAYSWSFECNPYKYETIEIDYVEPLFCLNLPCSDEKAQSINETLYWKCKGQSQCSLELKEMDAWGIRCAARIGYSCRSSSRNSGGKWLIASSAVDTAPVNSVLLLVTAAAATIRAVFL